MYYLLNRKLVFNSITKILKSTIKSSSMQKRSYEILEKYFKASSMFDFLKSCESFRISSLELESLFSKT